MTVEFVLPDKSHPGDLPYGTDLDNLLKRFLDALHDTLLEGLPGKDSALIELKAAKRRAYKGEETGAHVVLTD